MAPGNQMAMYFTNCKGNDQLIDGNNYTYTFFKKVGCKSYFRCVKKCSGMAIVEDDIITKTPVHDHTENQDQLEAKLCELRAIKKSCDLNIKPSQILAELHKLPANIKCFLSTDKAILERMKKKRIAVRKGKAAHE